MRMLSRSIVLLISAVLRCVSSTADLLHCQPIDRLDFTSIFVSSLHPPPGHAHPLYSFRVLLGRDVAVVTRGHTAIPGPSHLVGVYYCGKYVLASSDIPVSFLPEAGPLSDELKHEYRRLVWEHSEDRYLCRKVLLYAHSDPQLLTFAVTYARRIEVDRHLRQLLTYPPSFHGSNLICGSMVFPVNPLQIIALNGDLDTLSPLELHPLCWLLPDLIQHFPTQHISVKIDGLGDGKLIEVGSSERQVVLVCPGKIDDVRIRVYPHSPRGQQLQDLHRQRMHFFNTPSRARFISFAQLCADESGVPSWLSGKPPGTDRVQLHADLEWAKVAAYGLGNAMEIPDDLFRPPVVHADDDFSDSARESSGDSGECVAIEELEIDGYFSAFNSDLPGDGLYQSREILAGKDVAFLLETQRPGIFGRAQILGIYYCGKFYSSANIARHMYSDQLQVLRTLNLMNTGLVFAERNVSAAFGYDTVKSLRELVQIFVENSEEGEQNRSGHGVIGSFRFARIEADPELGHELRSNPEAATHTSVSCGSLSVEFNRIFVDPKSSILTIDTLESACFLAADVFNYTPDSGVGEITRGPGGAYMTETDVVCPGGRVVARNGHNLFIETCVDEHGVPDWLQDTNLPSGAYVPVF